MNNISNINLVLILLLFFILKNKYLEKFSNQETLNCIQKCIPEYIPNLKKFDRKNNNHQSILKETVNCCSMDCKSDIKTDAKCIISKKKYRNFFKK